MSEGRYQPVTAETYPRWARGAMTGIGFPTSIEGLMEAGPEFLTEAFRATGRIGSDNRVTAVSDGREFIGGGMGRKLILSVAYECCAPSLPTELFVKYPRDFGDPLRPVFAPFMESETRFALLSCSDDFPIRVPFCLYADFDPVSMTGILVTERIRFGVPPIEPAQDKCMDYRIADPLRYYRALAAGMARLAGFHKAGKLGAEIDRLFPLQDTRILGFDGTELDRKLERLRALMDEMPQLFPDGLSDAAFFQDFARDVAVLVEHEATIRGYLNARADQVALCHLNANIDNAWFERSSNGSLEAGLLDWGGVGQMNLGAGYYGLVCSAEPSFLNAHRQELMKLIVAEYAASGGERLDVSDFSLSAKLAFAMLGVAYMLDAPAIIANFLPDYRTLESRFDERLASNFMARVQLQPLILLLNEWGEGEFGDAIRRTVRGN